jgi:hypothetical protein
VSNDQKEPKPQAPSCTHRTYQREHNFILTTIVMKLKYDLSYDTKAKPKAKLQKKAKILYNI